MAARISPFSIVKALPCRPRLQNRWVCKATPRSAIAPSRCYSESKNAPAADRSKRVDAKPLDHVSEEAAQTAEIMGQQGPDISQGTPVEEVVKNDDKAAHEKLPKVMQDAIKAKAANSPPKGARSYSTMVSSTPGAGGLEMGLVGSTAADVTPATVPETPGFKYAAPALPIPKDAHVKHRYDPVVEQVTNLLMRHGQKSKAQRNMALILQHLRTSPIPNINPNRPLILGAPPPSHLPLNPVLYLTLAIDSVAPVVRIKSQKGAAGGGVALQVPVPLGQRQRRRTAVQWILAASDRRPNKGSGKGGFATRIAEELVAVVEGRSSAWDRRNGVHKSGVTARANVVLPRRR